MTRRKSDTYKSFRRVCVLITMPSQLSCAFIHHHDLTWPLLPLLCQYQHTLLTVLPPPLNDISRL